MTTIETSAPTSIEVTALARRDREGRLLNAVFKGPTTKPGRFGFRGDIALKFQTQLADEKRSRQTPNQRQQNQQRERPAVARLPNDILEPIRPAGDHEVSRGDERQQPQLARRRDDRRRRNAISLDLHPKLQPARKHALYNRSSSRRRDGRVAEGGGLLNRCTG